MFRLGVDVGGTNTDVVLLKGNDVVRLAKVPTSKDVTGGIIEAVTKVLPEVDDAQLKVSAVMVGTTHFLNAVLQKKLEKLQKVAVIRLSGPASSDLPPFVDWPEDLKEAVCGYIALVSGGYEISGVPSNTVSRDQILEVIKEIRELGIKYVAVSGLFSTINRSQELLVKQIFTEIAPDLHVTLSHEIGSVGLLERENATILNASLRRMADSTISAMEKAISAAVPSSKLFLVQNDGTLLFPGRARKYPIFTFSSGPVNSMRGAAFLTGLKNAFVIDVGGTSSDVGVLVNGFPRPAGVELEIGGIRSNFRMPDTVSVGIGGSSVITLGDDVSIGPTSVGYELMEKSKAFGGDTYTAFDYGLVSGLTSIEGADRSEVSELTKDQCEKLSEKIKEQFSHVISLLKVNDEDITLVVVGGGAFLVPEQLDGVGKVIKPAKYSGVANAVGAAIAKVSAEVEILESYETLSREAAKEKLLEMAEKQIASVGGVLSSFEVLDQSEVPISYIPGKFHRLYIKAVADLDFENVQSGTPFATGPTMPTEEIHEEETNVHPHILHPSSVSYHAPATLPLKTLQDLVIDPVKGWKLDEVDVEYIALGSAFLGSGGGGNAYLGKIRTILHLKRGKEIYVIPPASLEEDANVAPAAFIGAPSTLLERLSTGEEVLRCFKKLSPPADAVVPVEIGGCNSMEPLIIGALLELPVCDCDGMGRAFPRIPMVTWYFRERVKWLESKSYLCGSNGKVIEVDGYASNSQMEAKIIPHVVALGMLAGIVTPAVSKETLIEHGVVGTLSKSWLLGRSVVRARNEHSDPVAAMCQEGGGRLLVSGKIVDVQRSFENGIGLGSVKISGRTDVTVEFQNEFLIVKDSNETVLAVVPDIIAMVDTDSGRPILSEEVRYGLRVSVVVLPAPAILRSVESLKYIGPACFGFEGIECNFELPAVSESVLVIADENGKFKVNNSKEEWPSRRLEHSQLHEEQPNPTDNRWQSSTLRFVIVFQKQQHGTPERSKQDRSFSCTAES
eukprot:TRINITY_DN2343_c0_g2_i1.p1 TRINITY_DN2343_c0_g2~~TRINITY_DN2343_c0_g2_i1.p1  ORF type:complete len:1031 (+),score=187.63 TRINITY_DN2343_c0_g2_i1:57-3095(+)